ncbi:MAG: DUF167 domain-containing protein [Phycisphaerales bacterium]|nr:DUF167 domain-containing protein [Phycisphaerales bacterium]
MGEPERVKAEAGAVVFAVKAVPGARREEVAGWLGDRLKVRVSQPAEGGKANRAICALLAAELDIPEAHIELVRGHTSPEKLLRIRNLTPEAILARWP